MFLNKYLQWTVCLNSMLAHTLLPAMAGPLYPSLCTWSFQLYNNQTLSWNWVSLGLVYIKRCLCYMFLTRKQKWNEELSKDNFRVFQHKLSWHVTSGIPKGGWHGPTWHLPATELDPWLAYLAWAPTNTFKQGPCDARQVWHFKQIIEACDMWCSNWMKWGSR